MGTKGRRKSSSCVYEEPTLLSDVAKIQNLAKEKGFYDGDSLDIEKLINEISSQSPASPIEIRKIPMLSYLSGSLCYKDGKWIMTVNSKHHENRQRFTLVHELAHYILHKEKNTEFEDSTFFRGNNMDSLEYMANDFAATLLMPDEKIVSYINEGVRNLGKLAKIFNVSAAAMKYKVEKLGYKVR